MVYQKYSVVNEVGTVMVGMVIDGKVNVGIERSVMGVMDIGVKDIGVKDIGVKDIGVKDIGVRDIGVKDIGVNEKGVIDIDGIDGIDIVGTGGPESNEEQSRLAQQPCTPSKITQWRPQHDSA